ncbi:MAG TPA: hypothetical protein VKX46_04970, partial [Ktedonobacteraceae bacterium]|nr:hypothetical protein [Ktedonobacteraceae bacterium]
LVTLDYYQHKDLYGNTAGTILKAGEDRYSQAIRDYVGLPDSHLSFLLHSQINGLLVLRMLRGINVSLVEQARPFIDMLVDYLQKTPA